MAQRFPEKIYRIVRQIPTGKVATYGWIAIKLDNPRAARAVGSALHNNPDPKTIPCHRVVNRKGRVATNFGNGGWREQKRKLLKEGIGLKDKNHVDLKRYLWQKSG